jgi:hypothetical protein
MVSVRQSIHGPLLRQYTDHRKAKATEKAAETNPSPNEFLKLDPTTNGPTETKSETSTDPKIYSDNKDPSYVGMPIVPLNPDAATSNTGASSTTQSTAITDKAGVTDKLWKETPLDDISRSGAPGAGPTGPSEVTPAAADSTTTTTTSPDPAIKTTAPDSVTGASNVYETGASTDTKTDTKTDVEKAPENRDTPGWTNTGVPSDSSNFDAATAKQNAASGGESKGLWTRQPGQSQGSTDGVAGLAGEQAVRKSESGRKSESADLTSSPSNEEKGSKMSHLKEKMKNKLHIGSKDK